MLLPADSEKNLKTEICINEMSICRTWKMIRATGSFTNAGSWMMLNGSARASLVEVPLSAEVLFFTALQFCVLTENILKLSLIPHLLSADFNAP